MVSPRPRGPDQPPDTFFLGPAPDESPAPLDLRDPRNRNLFHLSAADMDVENLSRGSRTGAPTVSASMATAALLYSGITVKMLSTAATRSPPRSWSATSPVRSRTRTTIRSRSRT